MDVLVMQPSIVVTSVPFEPFDGVMVVAAQQNAVELLSMAHSGS